MIRNILFKYYDQIEKKHDFINVEAYESVRTLS